MKISTKSAICVLALAALGPACNDDSGFNAGAGQQTQPPADNSDDARGAQPEPSSEPTPISNPDASGPETTVNARNPLGASDSTIFSYVASQETGAEFQITLDNQDVQTDFTLDNRYSDRTEEYAQINRTQLSAQFQQGSPGQPVEDMFDQSDKRGIVDILIVVDDSGSMRQEQENLSDKLDDLLTYLDQTNWQIGVVTTTPKDRCEITLINYQDPQGNDRFRTAVQPGTRGSGQEHGIKESVNGLRCNENPWVRSDSTVAVLIVSDEDNCSNDGRNCRGEPWETEQYLIDYVENDLNRVVGQNAAFYGIFSSPTDPCDTAYHEGIQYQRLVDYKANGQKRWGDICDNNYGNTLRKISENISSLIRNQWELSQTPDNAADVLVEIGLDGTRTPVDPGDYDLNGKILTFLPGREPPIGSKIYASYTVGATEMFDRVTTAEEPADGTVRVMIDGTVLNSGDFTVAGQEIIFGQQPSANASIQIDYRRNTPLQTQFAVSGTPKDNQLQVFVDNQATNNFTYDSTTKLVTFNNPPLDNRMIKFDYTNVDGPKLSYKLPISGDNARNFKLFYNNQELNFTRNQDTLTIDAADHEKDRTLTLRYEVDDTSEKMFPLPDAPLSGSVSVESDSMPCSLGNGFELIDSTLVSRCVVENQTQFTISYQYLATRKQFVLNEVEQPERFRWEVRINGQTTSIFTRTANTIVLNSEPPLGAKVDIYLSPLD
jgi:hypothetical protein